MLPVFFCDAWHGKLYYGIQVGFAFNPKRSRVAKKKVKPCPDVCNADVAAIVPFRLMRKCFQQLWGDSLPVIFNTDMQRAVQTKKFYLQDARPVLRGDSMQKGIFNDWLQKQLGDRSSKLWMSSRV